MLPVLKLASDGKEHKFSGAVEELVDAFIQVVRPLELA
jgi:hypothetical protein